jgi:predicted amidohydrolase
MSSLKVALVQFEPVWENSEASLSKLDLLLASLDKDTQLVLLPEMFNTGFSMDTPKIAEPMNASVGKWMAEKSKKYTIAGSFAVKEDDQYLNRIGVFQNQKCIGTYDKKHLFTLGDEDQHFQSGDQHLELELNGFNIQFFICYDLRFPEWIRNYSHYDAAVFMASWPKQRMPHWDALLKARAIENQSYVLAINRVGTDGNKVEHIGHSMAYSPFGDLIQMAENKECITYVTLDKSEISNLRETLPFLKDIKN